MAGGGLVVTFGGAAFRRGRGALEQDVCKVGGDVVGASVSPGLGAKLTSPIHILARRTTSMTMTYQYHVPATPQVRFSRLFFERKLVLNTPRFPLFFFSHTETSPFVRQHSPPRGGGYTATGHSLLFLIFSLVRPSRLPARVRCQLIPLLLRTQSQHELGVRIQKNTAVFSHFSEPETIICYCSSELQYSRAEQAYWLVQGRDLEKS